MLTVGQFCGRASELGIAESWHARTALEDMAGIPADAVNDDHLYRARASGPSHRTRPSTGPRQGWVHPKTVVGNEVAHPFRQNRKLRPLL